MAAEENKIQKQILDFLIANGIIAWRNNSNAQRNRANGFRKGIGDILGVLPDGTFLSVEVKTKTGRASEDQKKFIQEVSDTGAVAIIARSVDDVQTAIAFWL